MVLLFALCGLICIVIFMLTDVMTDFIKKCVSIHNLVTYVFVLLMQYYCHRSVESFKCVY